MKTVFKNDELLHVWANKGQPEGRNSNHSLSFIGDNLYSYRMRIATRVNGKLFMMEKGTSVTTSRHLSDARQAVHEEVHYVPDLTGPTSKPERGKPYPGAVQCLDAVKGIMLTIGTTRSLPKQRDLLEKAKKYESTAKLLLNGWKWPIKSLAEVGSNLSSEDLKALSKEHAKVGHIELYKTGLNSLEEYVAKLANRLELAKPDAEWVESQSTAMYPIGSLTSGRLTVFNSATRAYKLVYGKPSAALNKLKSKYDKLMLAAAPRLKALADREVDQVIEAQMENLINSTASIYRSRTIEIALRQLLKDNHNTKHKAAAEKLLKEWPAKHLEVTQRKFNDDLLALRASSAEPESKLDMCKLLTTAAVKITELGGEVKLADLAEVAAAEALAQEAIDAANKTVLADWLARHSARRPPAGSGTFARIKGDTVETNLGAIVPLKHAQRLAKVAQRVIKSGGKTWLPGTGPKVGYYEVKSIAADGATVIGCHEFSAEVANTMITKLLENVNEETFNHDDSTFIDAC